MSGEVRFVYKAKPQHVLTERGHNVYPRCPSGSRDIRVFKHLHQFSHMTGKMFMRLSEAENGMGYVVVDSANKNLLLQPNDRVKVTVNDGLKVVFRKIGTDERYSVSWHIAQGITIRKV